MHSSTVSTHQVLSNGEPCLLFQARKVSVRYDKQKQLDLTERAFSPQKPVDTSQSICLQDKATYVHTCNMMEPVRLIKKTHGGRPVQYCTSREVFIKAC